MTKTVEILDAMMGSGKSTAIFKWIDANPDEKYIYVSPNLTEVDTDGRIHQEVSKVEFHSPSVDQHGNTKSESLTKLLNEGKSIACTHSLYLSMTAQQMKIIENQGYVLALDEEINVMESFKKYSFKDITWLLQEGYISYSKTDGSIEWIKDDNLVNDTDHKYYYCKALADKKSLYMTRFDEESTTANRVMMVTHIPVKLIECAKRVIAITYLFKGSVLDRFLELKGFETKPFTEVQVKDIKPSDLKHLITLVPPDNKIKTYPMTSTWWESKASKQEIKDVQNYILRNARKYAKVPENLLWTCPKNRSKSDSPKTNYTHLNPIGFVFSTETIKVGEEGIKIKKPTWLSAKTRATNLYADRTVMIQCYNRYPMHDVACYLADYGKSVDADVFCLAEALQWFFRGCIRKGEPIVWCCANNRVYKLIKDWLDDKEIKGSGEFTNNVK